MTYRGASFFYKPKPKTYEIRKKRWNWPRMALQVLKRTCMVVGALVLFSALLGVISTASLLNKAAPPMPDDMILVLKLESGIVESAREPSIMEPFPFAQPTIRKLVDTLDKAAGDTRVRGFVLSLKGAGISLAHIQELRPAIARFREAGKFAYIYSPSYGEMGGLSSYYLASAFDQIWMQPVGMVSVAGINLEVPFAREVLDELGVSPEFFQREEFKSAMESLTEKNMPRASRIMLSSIVENLSAQMQLEISMDRGLTPQNFKNLVDKGILTGDEAVEAGLIDRLDYADVMIAEKREEVTGDPESEDLALVKFSQYAANVKRAEPAVPLGKKTEQIALVYAVGTIMPNDATDGAAAADDISSAIGQAADDEDIKAIVLRIDSPGGSPTASETIRRAVVRAKEKGKKVIVSMGPVAASGGYWIAAPADVILASPATLTGSIGVVMGKFNISGLWNKIGVNWDSVSWGENADFWSVNEGFDSGEEERMNVLIDDVYQAFLQRVAEGRNMSVEDVREIAKGRAWTGAQAADIGLVDYLGGLEDALAYTAKELGLEHRSQLEIEILPRPKSPIEQFVEIFGAQASLGKSLQNQSEILELLEPALRTVNQVRNPDDYRVYDSELESFR